MFVVCKRDHRMSCMTKSTAVTERCKTLKYAFALLTLSS